MSATTTAPYASFFVLVVSANGEMRYTRGNFVTKGAAVFEASQSNKLMDAYRAQGWDSVYAVFSAEEINAMEANGVRIRLA